MNSSDCASNISSLAEMKQKYEAEFRCFETGIRATENVCRSLLSGFEVKWQQELRRMSEEKRRMEEKRRTDTGGGGSSRERPT